MNSIIRRNLDEKTAREYAYSEIVEAGGFVFLTFCALNTWEMHNMYLTKPLYFGIIKYNENSVVLQYVSYIILQNRQLFNCFFKKSLKRLWL